MTTPDQTPDRFRSATEFPKTLTALSRAEADSLYEEMRACLIFTNRSRAQLLRRNEEHKQSALKLKTDVQRLQTLLNQLATEKQQLAQNNQRVVSALQAEIGSMSAYLDHLSTAFDQVADIDNPTQASWGFFALPKRFFNFIQAVRTIVLWWRDERGDESTTPTFQAAQTQLLESGADGRQEKPQMHDDPASVGRSLLDR